MNSVAVIIPAKNGYPEIVSCIEGILSQSVPIEEILVIDSGSTDKTIEYLQSNKRVRLIQIPPEDFSHGGTRNIGWQQCNSDFLVYTVQDAKPADENWIAELMEGFKDESVAGVCGQQMVEHDKKKNPVQWFRPLGSAEIKRYSLKSASEFDKLSAEYKKNMCSWDNVNAMYRRSVLARIPFDPIAFGEDMIWSKSALLAGYTIVYNYNARVFHYHHENYKYAYRRSFAEMYLRYKFFGYVQPLHKMSLRKRIGTLKTLFRNLGADVSRILRWYKYNLENFEALKQAHQLFVQTLEHGEEALDKKHEELCGKPPIPLKLNEQ